MLCRCTFLLTPNSGRISSHFPNPPSCAFWTGPWKTLRRNQKKKLMPHNEKEPKMTKKKLQTTQQAPQQAKKSSTTKSYTLQVQTKVQTKSSTTTEKPETTQQGKSRMTKSRMTKSRMTKS